MHRPAYIRSFFLVLLLSIGSSLQPASARQPVVATDSVVDVAEVEAHLRFLAADELMGRMTGRVGNNVAARYIAEQFRRAGLQELPGAEGYYQRIPAGSVQPPAGGVLVFGIDTLDAGRDMLMLEGDGLHGILPVIFAGYGISAPDLGYDDYEGKDVQGVIVAVKYGYPEGRDDLSGRALSEAKRRAATTHGAAAVIEFYEGRHRGRPLPWETMQSVVQRQGFRFFPDGETASHFWVNDPDGVWRSLAEGGGLRDAAVSTEGVRREPVRAQNVAGYVPGSDPALRNEYVLLLAHYDHIGTAGQAETYEPDRIYNGARDNAMGVTALITAARELAHDPPARSTIFLAVTGEEIGMIGSGYYVENPLVPLEQTVFALNSDNAGFNDTSVVTVVGLERTTAREAIQAGAAALGLEAIPDPVPEQNLFDRSDNARFAHRGVPAPTFSAGFTAFDESLMQFYHQTTDEVTDDFDFEYLLRFARAYAEAARNIADMPVRPYWTEGDPYQSAGDALYGYQ